MQAKRYGAVAALLIVSSAFAPALAAAPNATEEFTIRVAYGDLDINEADGAKMLYDRLERAAARACEVGSYYELGSLDRYRSARKCYRETLDRLVAKIDSARLERLHASS